MGKRTKELKKQLKKERETSDRWYSAYGKSNSETSELLFTLAKAEDEISQLKQAEIAFNEAIEIKNAHIEPLKASAEKYHELYTTKNIECLELKRRLAEILEFVNGANPLTNPCDRSGCPGVMYYDGEKHTICDVCHYAIYHQHGVYCLVTDCFGILNPEGKCGKCGQYHFTIRKINSK